MSERPTVVLIHGLFGFQKRLGWEYFGRVRPRLEAHGLAVVAPALPWASSIAERAQMLANTLAPLGHGLHLVGHSMGGLDARYWIRHLGGARQVASLTTLGTPHRGSAVADHCCRTLSPYRLFAGVRDLTRSTMRDFNARTPDVPTVRYRSYSAARAISELPWFVRRYGRLLETEEGANDGLVAASSACWGEHLARLPADHFELIGLDLWLASGRGRRYYDVRPIYDEIGAWIARQ